MNLRDFARDKACQVRIPAVCNGDPATTVLAHVRALGISGMGLKAPDILGAWCCSACHDAIDRRRGSNYTGDELRLMHLEGMLRTIGKLVELEKIRW